MREREDIQEEVAESKAESYDEETVRLLILEVLLDIRDLLRDRLPPSPL